jgi:hypothetical protein
MLPPVASPRFSVQSSQVFRAVAIGAWSAVKRSLTVLRPA